MPIKNYTLLLLLLVAISVFSEQRYYLDVDTVWEARTGEGGENFYFPPYPPAVLGDKFANGDVYQRLVIEGKPSDLKCMCWICPWQGGAECCTKPPMPVIYFTGDGTYYTKFKPITQWPGAHNNLKFNPDVAVRRTVLQVFGVTSSGSKKKLRADHWSNTDIVNHVPFDIETEVILVAKGDNLTQPQEWPDCPAEWGCTGDGVAANSRRNAARTNNVPFSISRTSYGTMKIISHGPGIRSISFHTAGGREILSTYGTFGKTAEAGFQHDSPSGYYIITINKTYSYSLAHIQ